MSSRRRRSSSRAIRTRAVCSARARRRAIAGVHFFENSAPPGSSSSGQRSCRCQSSVVVERDALADEPFAVIDQQPEVELGPGQLRDRQRLEAFAQRGAGDGERVDAVGLAALAAARARAGHQPGRDPDDALAAGDQEPLEGARDVPAVLQRPDPLAAEAARPHPAARRSRARRPATVFSPSSSPVAAATAAIVCERLCMSAPSTIIALVLLHLD